MESPTSSQTISARGIIIEPIWRSSRRNTLRTIWCSCASMTPASRPSSRLAAISSSVTLRPTPPRMPSSCSVASVTPDSNITSGRVIIASTAIGRATRRATVSGCVWPRRLGTSSPKMMVRIVMMMTTSAVATIGAASSSSPSVPTNQPDNGAAKAASPTMPLSTPIDVMPICTVDRKRVGLSCSSIAASAPGSSAATITCRRALRLAVSAISDIAKTPFRRIRNMRRATSMHRPAAQQPA